MSNVDKKGATTPTVLTGFVSKALLKKKQNIVVVKDTSDADRIVELEAQLASNMEDAINAAVEARLAELASNSTSEDVVPTKTTSTRTKKETAAE